MKIDIEKIARTLLVICAKSKPDDIIAKNGPLQLTAFDIFLMVAHGNMVGECPQCGSTIGVNIDCDFCHIYAGIEGRLNEN